MKKPKLVVKKMAKNVQLFCEDLRKDFGVSSKAERELNSLKTKVSPQLYGMLQQSLIGFHDDMQLEMAENLVIFEFDGTACTTGCPSVDSELDFCYIFIAMEKGWIKKGFLKREKK